MSESPDRLRAHPEERFRPPQQRIDLHQAAARLEAEPLSKKGSHRQETLYRHGPLTVALFLFERGAHMPNHAADGVVTVHVLEGLLSMNAQGREHRLSPGQLLVLAPGVEHDVRAQEASRMLLTVCLESTGRNP